MEICGLFVFLFTLVCMYVVGWTSIGTSIVIYPTPLIMLTTAHYLLQVVSTGENGKLARERKTERDRVSGVWFESYECYDSEK
jgi:hypothetical protein